MKKTNRIISSADAFMTERICADERVDDAWFFVLFSTINYNPRVKSLQLISLKEMWQYGFVVKRYLEYPDVLIAELSNVFEEISIYIQRKDYVVHFINENLTSDEINIILDISLAEQKVDFLTWQFDNKMCQNSLSYEEYYERYISSDSSPKRMRFDIYQPIERDTPPEVLSEALLKRINRSKISGLNKIHCLLAAKRKNVSSKVLQEWLSAFEFAIDWLCDQKFLETNSICGEEEKQLFAEGKVYNDIRHLNQMIKVYNKLLDRLNKCILRY